MNNFVYGTGVSLDLAQAELHLEPLIEQTHTRSNADLAATPLQDVVRQTSGHVLVEAPSQHVAADTLSTRPSIQIKQDVEAATCLDAEPCAPRTAPAMAPRQGLGNLLKQ